MHLVPMERAWTDYFKSIKYSKSPKQRQTISKVSNTQNRKKDRLFQKYQILKIAKKTEYFKSIKYSKSQKKTDYFKSIKNSKSQYIGLINKASLSQVHVHRHSGLHTSTDTKVT